MHRSISSLPLAPAIKVKLATAGFDTCADLSDLRPLQLSKEACISQQEALEVLQSIRSDADRGGGKAARGGVTALQLLQTERARGDIITGCSALDAALGGGVPLGKTTEICGAPGVGKTQLCMQLAVCVRLPECVGGRGAEVLYIDTEGSFLVQRAAEMAHAAIQKHTHHTDVKGVTVESILSQLWLLRCHDYTELLAHTHLLNDFLNTHPQVQLLVIDSIAFPFRHFEDYSQRTRLLNGLAQRLTQLATQYSVAVVLTNQMTTKVWSGQSKLVPALGESWGHAATQRLILHWEGTQRLASIYKSPSQMEATVAYCITEAGFQDVVPLPGPAPSGQQTSSDQSQQSKRPRMEARPP
ncbi:DNA repair protein RAD51 homolog 3 [Engraulis encrasicolus]|uniref:DNA repair protein RAD51 homolog 3 n=1 Tax=Engraulis encrasicolus TaxID=184585 RepID=UPI002FD4E121